MQVIAATHKKSRENVSKPVSSKNDDANAELKVQQDSESNLPIFLQRFAASSPSSPPPLQRQADEENQEQDLQTKPADALAQFQPLETDEEDNVQTNIGASSIQRQPLEEEEEPIQTKLNVGDPDDEYEREADEVADNVMRMPDSYADSLGDEPDEQTKLKGGIESNSSVPPYIQSSFAEINRKDLQRTLQPPDIKTKSERSTPPPENVSDIIESAGSGSSLPKYVRIRIEPILGRDLSHVKLHSDTRANQAARALNARAFTHQEDIYLGKGQSAYDVGLMAHEAAHVVQQEVTQKNIIQRLVTSEGDYVPDPLIVDWGERFEITFGTRTTGYGDVLIQYKIRYLGSFTGDPGDLNFAIERDPAPGARELGKPNTRRINAELIDSTSESIKLDVYGDGSVIHELWHTIAWSQSREGEMHQFDLMENGKFIHRRNLTSIDTRGVALRPEVGIVKSVTPVTFTPDPARTPQLPTGMLLDMILGRLKDLRSLPLSRNWFWLLMRLNADQKATTKVGDDAGIALSARRLLDLLTYLGPVFATLEDMSRPEQYLGGLEFEAQAEVDRITDLYVNAMIEAYIPPGGTKSLSLADKALLNFPNWLNFLYLRDPRGVQSMIGQIPAMQAELRTWRSTNNTTWNSGMSEADELVKIDWGIWGAGSLYGGLTRQRESAEWAWRDEENYVQELIRDLFSKAQLSIALLTAMTVHEQMLYMARELNHSWINAGMEATLWGERTDLAWKYVRQIDDIIQLLSYTVYEKDSSKKQATIQDGLSQLSDLLGSSKFQSDVEDFQTRLKWVERINFVAKLAVIVAAAALTGGTAGSLAFAGLRALGAGVALATAGELAVGGLVFTLVSRGGQQIMFGKAEGSFLSDLFWNTVTLGVLKATNHIFTGLFKLRLNPKVAQVRYHLGRAATAMVALHGVAEMHHLASKGEWMSGEERVNAMFQNVALMVALEAGRFITGPLESRLTKALVTKLKIDVKLAARIDALAAQRKPLINRLESLSRGELSPAEVEKLLLDLEALWAKELKLVDDGVNRKILTEGEMQTAFSAYNQHIAGMQLRLSQLGVEAPAPGGTTFRPMARGVIAYSPEGRSTLEKYYTPDSNDPSTAGKSLKESKDMPGVLEGRMPNGELTYYIPEGTFPKAIAGAKEIIAGRDAAVLAAKNDPVAAEGFRRLQEGLKGAGPEEKALSIKNVDAILGSMAPETVVQFLRAMADPAFTQRVGSSFYMGLAARPQAIDFARAYGPETLVKIWRVYHGWNASMLEMMLRARMTLEAAKTPEARKEFIDKLTSGDRATVNKLLGNVKIKPPRQRPVSKKTLGVDPSSTEWLALRNDAAAFAKRHNALIPSDKLDMMADLLQIHSKAMLGKFGKWRGNQAAIENLLDRFDQLAEEVAKADPAGPEGPWYKTIGNWRNSIRGAIGEAVGRPEGVAKFKGAFLKGQPVAPGTMDSTAPDYGESIGGVMEWVNIKSDLLTVGDPGSRSGVYQRGVDAARTYRGKAVIEAGNLPAGETYSLHFLHDPLRAMDVAAGRRTEKAMLDILFGNGSPIARVKFGTRPWITREVWQSGGSK